MNKQKFNVLFLCTGNSARSILGECLINRFGEGKFVGYSAGSHPKGVVNPYTLWVLEKNKCLTDELRSKDLDEFTTPEAPKMDFVFTVCDKAATEVCPVWPGQTMTAHWGIADPAAVDGREVDIQTAFQQAFNELQNRISIFVNLSFESLDKRELQHKLEEIGKIQLDLNKQS